MNHCCVQIDIDLNVSTEEWLRHCEQVVDKMLAISGLEWKLWIAGPAPNTAGGIYLFRDESSASAYIEGPIIAALRGNPNVREARVRVYAIDDHLSRKTRAVGGRPDEALQAAKAGAASVPASDVERFAGRVLGDLSAAMTGVMVRLGHQLGLYRALGAHGPLTSLQLAEHASVGERYAREWLHQQRAAGYLDYEPERGAFRLAPGACEVLVAEDSPAFLLSAFDIVAAMWADEARLMQAFRSGQGISWGEHDPRLFDGCARFFGTAYASHLEQSWLPALDGVASKLAQGAKVADVGCGHGVSTVLMARAFPASSFVGFDSHAASIDTARQRAEQHQLAGRVRFEHATATDYGGERYDLICFMDSFHDMGDAVAAARHAARKLADGGSVMLVELLASARPEENQGPLAAMNYAASTALCTPNALCHRGGVALGAQAGPEALQRALAEGGLHHFRIAAKTPFHMLIEARAH
ncbi:MAG: YdhR family protein [Polyangiaceae bacterium]